MPQRDASPVLLYLLSVWPEPNTTAAGVRSIDLIRELQKHFTVHLASAARVKALRSNEGWAGIQCHSIGLNDDSLEKLLKVLKPKVCLFDRFIMEEQHSWKCHKHCPESLQIVDTQDLHFLRQQRGTLKSLTWQETLELPNFQMDTAVLRELSSILRADAAILTSEAEIYFLEQKLNLAGQGSFLGFGFFDPEPLNLKLPSFDQRQDFIWLGHFRHEPNIESVYLLKEWIWPKIREQIPQAKLRLYGTYMPRTIKALHSPEEGFLLPGTAKNLQTCFQKSRVNLAPLRFGAGLKGKILQGWKYGCPAVSSPIGAEGLSYQEGSNKAWGGRVALDPLAFVKEAIELYQNRSLWLQCQGEGLHIYQEQFQSPKQLETLVSFLLHSKRRQGLQTLLLRHEGYRATENFSRYLQIKKPSMSSATSKAFLV